MCVCAFTDVRVCMHRYVRVCMHRYVCEWTYVLQSAVHSPPGQLIIPESLKLLPVLVTGLYKSRAVRPNATEDERAWMSSLLLGSPLPMMLRALYPFVYPVHRSVSESALENLGHIGERTGIEDFVLMPPSLASSGEEITTDGIFLVDDGVNFWLYFGREVELDVLRGLWPDQKIEDSASFFRDSNGYLLWDCTESAHVKGQQLTLRDRINACIRYLRRMNYDGAWQTVKVVVPGSIEESELRWELVEDRLGSERGYIDFLCDVSMHTHNTHKHTCMCTHTLVFIRGAYCVVCCSYIEVCKKRWLMTPDEMTVSLLAVSRQDVSITQRRNCTH